MRVLKQTWLYLLLAAMLSGCGGGGGTGGGGGGTTGRLSVISDFQPATRTVPGYADSLIVTVTPPAGVTLPGGFPNPFVLNRTSTSRTLSNLTASAQSYVLDMEALTDGTVVGTAQRSIVITAGEFREVDVSANLLSEVESVTVEGLSSVTAGDNTQYTAYAKNDQGATLFSGAGFNFTSSNPLSLLLDPDTGTASALQFGSATVTATLKGTAESGEILVQVHKVVGVATTAWPQMRGSTENTGAVSRLPATGLVVWDVLLPGRPSSGPVLTADGAVLVGMMETNGLARVSESNGDVEWVYATDGALRSTPLLGDNGIAYFANEEALHAVNATTGEQEWTLDLSDTQIIASPVLLNGTLFVGDLAGRSFAVRASDGQLSWQKQVTGSIHGRAIVTGQGNICFSVANGVADGGVVCYDALSGNEQWFYHSDSLVQGFPVRTDSGDIAFGDESGNIYVISELDGSETNRKRGDHPVSINEDVRSVGVTQEGDLIVGTGDGNIASYTLPGLSLNWIKQHSGYISTGAISTTGDALYIGTRGNVMLALRKSDGGQIWSFDIGGLPQELALDYTGVLVFGGFESNRLVLLR